MISSWVKSPYVQKVKICIPFHVCYTYIGMHWISPANSHLDFQYEILPQSLWFSFQDFCSPNELIQPTNVSHHHLSLPPSIEGTDSGQTLERTTSTEQTDHDHTTQSNLIPLWNWPCSKEDCIKQTPTTAQECLQRTPEDSQHTQEKSGLVYVNALCLYLYSLIPFTNPWQTNKQTKMTTLEFSASLRTLKAWQLICHLLFPEH